jgi:hypothetical protein
MEITKKLKSSFSNFLLIIAFVCLANPSVQVVDIFPDFIAYLIIARKLSYAVPRAPYFAEAKSAFSRLVLISLMKLPAYFVIISARSGNVGDNDIYALFAFTFAALEAVFSVKAVYYLFEAVFYLGQRSEASPLIKPFYINKKKTRSMTPEALRTLFYVFAIYRCAAYGLPELLLLTKTVTAEQLKNYFNITKLYPYAVLLSVISVLVLAVITLSRAHKYIKASSRVDFKASLDALVSTEKQTELLARATVGDIFFTLTTVLVSTLFTIEIRLDNFSHLNLLPLFIMGVILLFASHRLSRYTRGAVALKISLFALIVISCVAWIFEIKFLSEYSFSLLATSGLVKREAMPWLILSLCEFIAFAVSMILLGNRLYRLAREHTGRDFGTLDRTRIDFYKKKRLSVIIFSSLSVLVGAARYTSLVLRYFAKNITVNIENDGLITQGTVTEPLLPWFSVVVTFLTVIYIFYTYYFLSSLKDDVKNKYL